MLKHTQPVAPKSSAGGILTHFGSVEVDVIQTKETCLPLGEVLDTLERQETLAVQVSVLERMRIPAYCGE